MKKLILVFILYFSFCILHSRAQLTPIVDSIPMSDGKKLAADIYIPSGCSGGCPTILIQTPYNRLYYHWSLPLGIGLNLNSSPYVFVIVDWRCFYGSTNACVATPDRGQDGYDVIQWITAQPWSNGKVGTWGASALGVIQFQTAAKHPPGLICSVPIVASPVTSYFDYYPAGVRRTEYVQQLAALGYNMTYVLAYPYYNIGWQTAENNSDYPDSIAVPMLMIGGWYDHNTDGVLDFFSELRTQSALPVRNQHRLLMGPWTHNAASGSPATVGQLSYPQAAGYSDNFSNMFFDYYLRNISNGWTATPYVNYFQMGENTWQNNASWPPTVYNKRFYLHGPNALDLVAPTIPVDNTGFSYDPREPSPTVGGPTLSTSLNQGPYDQEPVVENRNDIKTFSTALLTQNIQLRGKPVLHLNISSDQKDTDFDVRLTDVYPSGTSMLVADGAFRMRFRNGYTTADTSSIVPGQIYSITIDMPNTAITFLAGHRIRVDVTSSNYPRFDNNLNNGGLLYVAGDTNIAIQTIYMDNTHASWLELPVTDSTLGEAELAAITHNMVIYPNPALNSFTIRLTEELGMKNGSTGSPTAELKVYDVMGKIAVEELLHSQLSTLNCQLSTGIYLVRVETTERIYQQKLVVE